MKISRIESMVYGVEDLDAGIRYFEDWGVPLVRRGAAGADFRLPSGQTILVRHASDKSLPSTAESGCDAALRTVRQASVSPSSKLGASSHTASSAAMVWRRRAIRASSASR